MALVLNDPSRKGYEDDARALTSFLEQHVWRKWTGGYSDDGDASEHNETIGRFGVIALRLYQATGKPEYVEYVNRGGGQLKKSLRLNSRGAYYWPGYTNGGEEDVYDTSHSGDIVDFMVEAHRAGLVFAQTDIQRLANTVKRNLCNGSLLAPQCQDYVDGGNHSSQWSEGGYGKPGRNQGGWVKLAQFDRELQEIYYNWVNTGNVYPYDRIKVGVYGELAWALVLAEAHGTGSAAHPAGCRG